MGSLVLLDLMGGVALLLWGLHMVHSGILHAFGPDLRLPAYQRAESEPATLTAPAAHPSPR